MLLVTSALGSAQQPKRLAPKMQARPTLAKSPSMDRPEAESEVPVTAPRLSEARSSPKPSPRPSPGPSPGPSQRPSLQIAVPPWTQQPACPHGRCQILEMSSLAVGD